MNADLNHSATTTPAGPPGAGAKTVGALLAETRLASGQDISDVAHALRISKRYLSALEEGRREELPAAAYAIGFVRSYAKYLDLDPVEIVRLFKAESSDIEGRSELSFPKPIPEGGVPGGLMLVAGLVVVVLAYGIWSLSTGNAPAPERVAQVPERLVEKTAPPEPAAAVAVAHPQANRSVLTPAAEPKPTPGPTPGPTTGVEPQSEPAPAAEPPPAAETETETVTAEPVSPSGPVAAIAAPRIQVRAKTNSWIQVRDETEDKLLFTRLLRQGDIYDVPNRDGLTLLTGNAGALDILVDGKVVPAIGATGDVRRNVALDPDRLKAGTAVND